VIKFCELRFYIPQQFYIIFLSLKIIGHENHDNNLESSCIFNVDTAITVK
jgi:hypothetical protein